MNLAEQLANEIRVGGENTCLCGKKCHGSRCVYCIHKILIDSGVKESTMKRAYKVFHWIGSENENADSIAWACSMIMSEANAHFLNNVIGRSVLDISNIRDYISKIENHRSMLIAALKNAKHTIDHLKPQVGHADRKLKTIENINMVLRTVESDH